MNDLKTKIWSGITHILETQFDSKELDELLTEAVMSVLSVESKVPVMYVSFREQYTDGIYSTGLWRKGQVKLVDPKVAAKMIEHPDVYVPGEKSDDNEVVQTKAPSKKRDDDPDLEAGRDAVLVMRTKKEISEFVANNFSGHKLDMKKSAKVADYRSEAVRLIDQFHLPE